MLIVLHMQTCLDEVADTFGRGREHVCTQIPTHLHMDVNARTCTLHLSGTVPDLQLLKNHSLQCALSVD